MQENNEHHILKQVPGGKEDNKVVELHNPSPHDIKLRDGTVLKFILKSAGSHIDVVYYTNRVVQLPFGQGEREIEDIVFRQCMELKWWEKIIGRTIEDKVMASVTYYKNFVAEVQASEALAEKITERVNAASKFTR